MSVAESGPCPEAIVVVAHQRGGDIGAFLNRGDGTFQDPRWIPVGSMGSVTTGDLDGDGFSDLVATTGLGSDRVLVFPSRLATLTGEDCNANGVHDECDIATGTSLDANGNGVPDECDAVVTCTLGSVPSPIVLEHGSRAVAFSASMTFASAAGDLVWDRAVFVNNGEGEASRLVREAGIYLDVNGNGELDESDSQVGPSLSFPQGDPRIAFEGLAVEMGDDAPLSWFLVLELSASSDRVSSTPLALLFLLVSVAFAPVLLRPGRKRWIGGLGCLLLVVSVLAQGGCGDGGGSTPAPDVGPWELQMSLTELDIHEAGSGESVTIAGLPATAWSF